MIADLCEATGADVTEVARGIGLDPRIGTAFLRAGIGYGGPCLPKDTRALVHIGRQQGLELSLLEEVDHINTERVLRFVEKVRRALLTVRGKTLGVLGLAFKPETDDIREAPSLKVVSRLLGEGASLRLHDWRTMDNARQLFQEEPGRVVYSPSPYDAAAGAHALLLLTEWDEYRKLDLARLRDLMERPVLIDGRNLYDPEAVRALGFEYHSIGRP